MHTICHYRFMTTLAGSLSLASLLMSGCAAVPSDAQPSDEDAATSSEAVGALAHLIRPGLAATYFDNANLTGPAAYRVDSQVSFNWGSGAPQGVGADTFSVRWTGFVRPTHSESYKFFITSDDGVRLWIDGQQIVNQWNDHPPTTYSGTVALQAGKSYPIKIEYYDHTGSASIKLEWQSASQARQTIPSNRLSNGEPSARPIRGTFYYPWYPETWTVNGVHVSYQPDLGYYSSTTKSVVDKHIEEMTYAKFDVAISSWWGPGTSVDSRLPLLLDRTRDLGKSLKWAVYYEKEGFDNKIPTISELTDELNYLASRYTGHPAYAHVGGKPVIFVYNKSGCSVADRWKAASNSKWYVVLKVFPGYESCANQPRSWHQYGPGAREDHHVGYGFSISPGFWKADEATPLLKRNPALFRENVQHMVASGEPWQIVTTFNEWGEGTATEPATDWSSASGYGLYLDALHTDGN